MLTLLSGNRNGTCDGASRRDFLKVGTLALGGLTLADLNRSAAGEKGKELKRKSVIWIWLGGGPTHVETFDPKMTAPKEYRSITGEVSTPISGVTIGGSFPQIAQQAKNMAIVRSFAHGNSSHGTATQWVMTGYKERTLTRPSLGSILAKAKGTTDPKTGMPTYVRMGNIRGDGPGWLGPVFNPFDPRGPSRRDMDLRMESTRLNDRRGLLTRLDRLHRKVDQSGRMDGMDGFEQQAFELILGGSKTAFDVKSEPKKMRDRYGRGLGESLLKARRLCEAGCGFVTVSFGGWDMHSNIERSVNTRAKQMDQAIAALIGDLKERGMLDDTLVVVTGEFGRTPKINRRAGRDHWGRLCTLAMAGGGLKMGQVIGESSRKLEVPKTNPITPQDVMATILEMYGLDHRMQFVNHQGRPVYLVENGKPISELI